MISLRLSIEFAKNSESQLVKLVKIPLKQLKQTHESLSEDDKLGWTGQKRMHALKSLGKL